MRALAGTHARHMHTHTVAEVEEVVLKPGCMWWLMPVIVALRNKSEASLGYKVRL